MIEDRFFEPTTKSMDEQAEEAYEKYLKDMEDQDGTPMTLEEFIDWFWQY